MKSHAELTQETKQYVAELPPEVQTAWELRKRSKLMRDVGLTATRACANYRGFTKYMERVLLEEVE